MSGPDEMDSSVGLDRFATNLPGIFGVLKMRAEDFRVEEVGKIVSEMAESNRPLEKKSIKVVNSGVAA